MILERDMETSSSFIVSSSCTKTMKDNRDIIPAGVGVGVMVPVKRGAWTPEEDQKLVDFIRSTHNNGDAIKWRSLPMRAGIDRCGKSCRLRWKNYLRPGLNKGPFTKEESHTVIQLRALLGNRWAAIASRLPGRTDNDVKIYWNSQVSKQPKLIKRENTQPGSPRTRHKVQWEGIRLETESRLSMESFLYPFGYPSNNPDPFLHLWNSEIGESFRKSGGGRGSYNKMNRPSVSPEDGSGITGQVDQTMEWCYVKPEKEEEEMSTESEETEMCLDMLLDSPTSD